MVTRLIINKIKIFEGESIRFVLSGGQTVFGPDLFETSSKVKKKNQKIKIAFSSQRSVSTSHVHASCPVSYQISRLFLSVIGPTGPLSNT